MNPSISVIIHTGNGAGPTERLLDSFIATNTHDPVELIVVHRSIPKKIAGVVAGFATRAFIRQVQADPDDSFGVACAAAASRAMYSHLLFLSDTTIFNQDVLPRVIPKLLESHDTLAGLQFCQPQASPARKATADFANQSSLSLETIDAVLCAKSDIAPLGDLNVELQACGSMGALAQSLTQRNGRKKIRHWRMQGQTEHWSTLPLSTRPESTPVAQDPGGTPHSCRTTPQPSAGLSLQSDTGRQSGSRVAPPMIQTVSSATAGETSSPLPGVAIIVCVHNAPEDVRQCLDALLRHTDLNRHHLILVDDGSEPETQRLLIPYITTTGATYIRNDNPRGYTIAANQGIRAANHPFVLLLNSDTITPAGWLERLIACALSGPRIACVGPLSNAASWQSIPRLTDASGQWLVNQLPQGTCLEEYAHRIASHSARIYPSTPFINGFCLLINRAAMASIGLLDEETFPRGYGEEDDFCLRAIDAGFENRVADDCYVFHAKSKSFTNAGRTATVALAKGKLTDKHGKRRIRNHVQSMQANEQLLIARTRARLAAEHPFAPPLPVRERHAAPHPLHIGWLQPHLQSVGGIRRTIEMTNRLVSRGHQVHLITPDGRKTDWLPIFAQVTPAEEARRIDFDLLLLSDPDMVPIHRRMKKRWTVNYHLAAYMLYREANADLKRYYAGDAATTHIANSAWTAQQAEKHHGIQMQGIFPGGIDKRLFRPHAVEKTFDLVCYGSDRPHKGTADIRQAAGRRSLLQLAYLGLAQQDLARHICNAKVFVSGCWHEGFNFCPLEAMSCGVPVVMTDCGGSREYALDGINALVVPARDTQALENAIQRLLDDTELRLKLIENGLETAWRHDWDSITQRFCELIEHLAL